MKKNLKATYFIFLNSLSLNEPQMLLQLRFLHILLLGSND